MSGFDEDAVAAGSHPRADAAVKFLSAVADDLELLANLHDREPTAELIEAARDFPVQQAFGLILASEPALCALSAVALAAGALPKPVDATALEELATGYADVYLKYTYRASPTESVWLTEDGLERQAPMFKVRAFYRRHGLVSTDGANRPDDHLVIELRFLARLMREGCESLEAVADAARFMDEHLLHWVKKFAFKLVDAGAPDWYAAIALLTESYVEELRDHLTALTGHERPKPQPAVPRAGAPKQIEERYVPGAAPSW